MSRRCTFRVEMPCTVIARVDVERDGSMTVICVDDPDPGPDVERDFRAALEKLPGGPGHALKKAWEAAG